MISGNITERSLYPVIIDLIKEVGGTGISEVLYKSQPDIIFELNNLKWLLSVKIGTDNSILKRAFLQYTRHKEDTKIDYGMILFVPKEVRGLPLNEEELSSKFREIKSEVLIDTPFVKEEYGKIDFPQIMEKLIKDVFPKLTPDNITGFPLDTVILVLQQHVQEMMDSITLSDNDILKIITDKELLSDIGHTDPKSALEISRFLASYILLSQVLFLRLYSRYRNDVLPSDTMRHTKTWLRQAIKRIKDINYKPIYSLDVLDAVSDQYVEDTLDLIWGLEVERVKSELPGRIFHELMPRKVRKLLAAFYTRPQAADLLSKLTINSSNETIYDPSCGSGTILVSAYKRKLSLYRSEGIAGNPHQRFCEEEIFGSDIMPFAVHLTGANLSSLDPSVTLDRLQIILGDSLNLSDSTIYSSGVQTSLFPASKKGFNTSGEEYDVKLEKVDSVLMNPPFTKVERGIGKYVNMSKYGAISGYEVGLWGHFLCLANDFIKDRGTLGAVIPVNILRGRESKKVRKILFEEMTPLYIVKSTLNYGFSEYAEYRDILFVAKKGRPKKGHKVKFVLLKQDIKSIDDKDTTYLSEQIKSQDSIISKALDIRTYNVAELKNRFENLMWYFSTNDIQGQSKIESFANHFNKNLKKPPDKFLREGYRPVPKNVSKFMFLTRDLGNSRTEEAFLRFQEENEDDVYATTNMKVSITVEKESLKHSLRTGVGISRMDATDILDYVAFKPYKELSKVRDAFGFRVPKDFETGRYWKRASAELKRTSTNLVILHRIGLSSPSQAIIAFHSDKEFSPSNTLNVVNEKDPVKRKALAVIFNSIVFLSQFYLLKEDSTSRWANLRFYDVGEMHLIPEEVSTIKKLETIFSKYSKTEFPCIVEQLDENFYKRYDFFWKLERQGINQETLFPEERLCKPSDLKIKYDLEVCKALGMDISESELREVYCAISNDLIISRGLKRD